MSDELSSAPNPSPWRWDTIANFPVELSSDAAADRIVCHPEVWAVVRAILMKQARYTEIRDAAVAEDDTRKVVEGAEPVLEFFPRAFRITHSGTGGES
jgi:hypothetical protein